MHCCPCLLGSFIHCKIWLELKSTELSCLFLGSEMYAMPSLRAASS